jgi:hypothetical protein
MTKSLDSQSPILGSGAMATVKANRAACLNGSPPFYQCVQIIREVDVLPSSLLGSRREVHIQTK